jgi:hypothetical protein
VRPLGRWSDLIEAKTIASSVITRRSAHGHRTQQARRLAGLSNRHVSRRSLPPAADAAELDAIDRQ